MERLENSIDARIRRAAQRYVGSSIFAETSTGARLRVNALSLDGEVEAREMGLILYSHGDAFSLCRSLNGAESSRLLETKRSRTAGR